MIPMQLLRKCGYAPFLDPNTREQSFVRPIHNQGYYPRFHVYVERLPDGFSVALHLDQKQASYEGSNKHSGEYEGETVENEMKRIYAILLQFKM